MSLMLRQFFVLDSSPQELAPFLEKLGLKIKLAKDTMNEAEKHELHEEVEHGWYYSEERITVFQLDQSKGGHFPDKPEVLSEILGKTIIVVDMFEETYLQLEVYAQGKLALEFRFDYEDISNYACSFQADFLDPAIVEKLEKLTLPEDYAEGLDYLEDKVFELLQMYKVNYWKMYNPGHEISGGIIFDN